MSELERHSDLELIRMHVSAPNTAEGREAKALLDYRGYQAMHAQNVAIVRLTIALALFSFLQAASAAIQSYFLYRQSAPIVQNHDVMAPHHR